MIMHKEIFLEGVRNKRAHSARSSPLLHFLLAFHGHEDITGTEMSRKKAKRRVFWTFAGKRITAITAICTSCIVISLHQISKRKRH